LCQWFFSICAFFKKEFCMRTNQPLPVGRGLGKGARCGGKEVKRYKLSLNSKEIKPVDPKGNELWIFIGRTDDGTEAPILWLPDVKSLRIGKDPDAGKDWGQEEKGMAEDEVVGWHHWVNGHEFEQAQGDSEGQGSLACCSSWGGKELDTT